MSKIKIFLIFFRFPFLILDHYLISATSAFSAVSKKVEV